jgi:hypothetical protein
MPSDASVDPLLDRLQAVERRLSALAAAPAASNPAAPTGAGEEGWDASQVWGHMAEMLPHWLGEARRIVVAGRDAPTRSGREQSDPGRLAGIEQWRQRPPAEVMAHLSRTLAELRGFVGGLDAAAWSARADTGRAIMDLRRYVESYMVGHLEEHATQLERLRGTSG